MITDARLLKIGNGLDITNDNFVVRMITDHDGAIRDNIITPSFTDNVEVLSNNHLYVTGDSFELTLFDRHVNVLKLCGIDTAHIPIMVRSNLDARLYPGGIVQVLIPNGVTSGFLKLKLQGGAFLDIVSPTESLTFDYSITRIA
jgi:hypothetical protein